MFTLLKWLSVKVKTWKPKHTLQSSTNQVLLFVSENRKKVKSGPIPQKDTPKDPSVRIIGRFFDSGDGEVTDFPGFCLFNSEHLWTQENSLKCHLLQKDSSGWQSVLRTQAAPQSHIPFTWQCHQLGSGEETPVQTLAVHLAVLKMLIVTDVCVSACTTPARFAFQFRDGSWHRENSRWKSTSEWVRYAHEPMALQL